MGKLNSILRGTEMLTSSTVSPSCCWCQEIMPVLDRGPVRLRGAPQDCKTQSALLIPVFTYACCPAPNLTSTRRRAAAKAADPFALPHTSLRLFPCAKPHFHTQASSCGGCRSFRPPSHVLAPVPLRQTSLPHAGEQLRRVQILSPSLTPPCSCSPAPNLASTRRRAAAEGADPFTLHTRCGGWVWGVGGVGRGMGEMG